MLDQRAYAANPIAHPIPWCDMRLLVVWLLRRPGTALIPLFLHQVEHQQTDGPDENNDDQQGCRCDHGPCSHGTESGPHPITTTPP